MHVVTETTSALALAESIDAIADEATKAAKH
jgi:hypothetical protein